MPSTFNINLKGGAVSPYIHGDFVSGAGDVPVDSTGTPSNYGSLSSPPPVSVLQTGVSKSGSADGLYTKSGFAANALITVVVWAYSDQIAASVTWGINDGLGHSVTQSFAPVATPGSSPASRASFTAQANSSGVLTLNFTGASWLISAIDLIETSNTGVTKTILWEGDSRTDQNETTQPPKLLAGLYGNANFVDADYSSLNTSAANNAVKVVSLALSGDSLQAILASELAQGDALWEGSTVIYIIDGGVNDIGGNSRTAAQTFSDLQSIVTAQAAKGYTVLIGTICQAGGAATDAMRASILTFNASVRSTYSASQIIDFARVQKLNNYTDTAYFLGDQIHYTDLGKALKAKVAYARLTGTDNVEPNDVGTVTPSVISSSQITLDWADVDDNFGVTDYLVRYSTANNVTSATEVAVGSATSAYNKTGLSASTPYYFWVKAKDAAGNVSANWSSVVSATTNAAGGGGGTPSFSLVAHVEQSLGASGGTSAARDTTGAHLIVIGVSTNTAATPTDSKGNTWLPLTLKQTATLKGQFFYCLNPTVGTGHTFSFTGAYSAISVSAWASATGAAAFDTENGSTVANAASLTTGNVSPSVDGSLVISLCSYYTQTYASLSVLSTLLGNVAYNGGVNLGLAAGYSTQTAKADANPNWQYTGGTDQLAAVIAVFKPVSSGGGGDTTAPTGSITSPATGTTVSDTISVTVSASDNVAVASVQLKADGVLIGSADTSAPYTFSVNTTGLANGNRSITALITDTSGNTFETSAIILNVSNVGSIGSTFDYKAIQIPFYYNADEPDFEVVTRTHEYEDGGKTFNELNDTAPVTWTIIYTGVSTADKETFVNHYKNFRLSRPFSFLAKDGVTYTDVYYKSFKATHKDNQSWIHTIELVLIRYP